MFLINLQPLEKLSNTNYALFALDREPGSLTDIVAKMQLLAYLCAEPDSCWEVDHSQQGHNLLVVVLVLLGVLGRARRGLPEEQSLYRPVEDPAP